MEAFAHDRGEIRIGLGPAPQLAEARRQRLGRQLIGIRVRQRDVITVEVAEHHIGGVVQRTQNPLMHSAPHSYLQRVGQQAMPAVTQGHARIDDDAPIRQRNQTAEAPHTQGFRADDLKFHTVLPKFTQTAGKRSDVTNSTAER